MSQVIIGPDEVLVQQLKAVKRIEDRLRGRYYPGHTAPASMPCLVYQIRDGHGIDPLNSKARLNHTLFWLFLCAKTYDATREIDLGLPGIELFNQPRGVMIGGLEVRRIRLTREVSDEVLPSQINEEQPPRYRTRRVWISWMQPLQEV